MNILPRTNVDYIKVTFGSWWFVMGVVMGFIRLLEKWFQLNFPIPHWALISFAVLGFTMAQYKAYEKLHKQRTAEIADKDREIQRLQEQRDHYNQAQRQYREEAETNLAEMDRLKEAARIQAERRRINASLTLVSKSPGQSRSMKMAWAAGHGSTSALVSVPKLSLLMINEGDDTIRVVGFRLIRAEPKDGKSERIEHHDTVQSGGRISIDVTHALIRAICCKFRDTDLPDYKGLLGQFRVNLVMEYRQDLNHLETPPESAYLKIFSSGSEGMNVQVSHEPFTS